jgi:tetratricopeptide (TPR) repeat protein
MKTFFFTITNNQIKSSLLYAGCLLSIVIFTAGCSDTKANDKSAVAQTTTASILDIPPLFERKGELAKEEDWAKTKEKVGELNEKLKQNNRDVKTRLKIVTIYLAEARITGEHPYYYPSVLKMVDGILSIEPQNFEALTYKASVLMSQHRFKDALQVAESAKKLNPDNAYIYGVLVDANVELGNYEEAVKMSDIMQGMKPSLESYSRASYLREIYGDYKGSIQAMMMAVQAGLPGSEPHSWSKKTLGYLYEQTGDFKSAEKQYISILAERPSYAFALEGLARVEKHKRNYDQALKYLNEASAVMPEFSFHEEMADIYALQGKTEDAAKKYNEVIQMLQEDAASGHIVHLDLSKLYLKAGNVDSAAFYAEKEYKVRPENIDVLRAMAEVSFRKNDISAAKEYITKASRTGSKNPELIVLASEIKKESGKLVDK